ncbi:MAG: hypothetical protein M3P85_03010 [Actinomycetota bacterium]|nr:hypothetical protein [Actinomycetota bacterium]
MPQVLERPAGLRFVHRPHRLKARRFPDQVVAVAPAGGTEAPVWVVLVENGDIGILDVEAGEFEVVARLREPLDLPYSRESWLSGRLSAQERARLEELDDWSWRYKFPNPLPPEDHARVTERGELDSLSTGAAKPALVASGDARFAALYNRRGRRTGVVFDLSSGDITMRLDHQSHHSHASLFPVSFFDYDGRSLLVHATAWNRLDVSDPASGELLTPRPAASKRSAGEAPAHYLDYFHGTLLPSPDGGWIADQGWVWHPVGVVSAWDLHRWVTNNVWESETGPSRRTFCARDYFSDSPMCWVGPRTLAVWGFGEDADWIIPAVRIFDAPSGAELGWFPGPFGELAFDGRYLHSFSKDHGTSVWDLEAGARVHYEWGLCPVSYHPASGWFLSLGPDDGLLLSRVG